MKTIHCPRCGDVTDATGLNDTAEIHCLGCGFHYNVADGHIWNVTLNETVAHVSEYLHWLIDLRQLHPIRFKAAVASSLSDLWAWPAWSHLRPHNFPGSETLDTESLQKALDEIAPGEKFIDLSRELQSKVLQRAQQFKQANRVLAG